MKKILALLACLSMTGCGTVFPSLQKATNAAAAKYGVPQSVVDEGRKVLGIPDSNNLPDPSRVLPAGYKWERDILDGDGKIVDVTKFRKGPLRIVPDGTAPGETVTAYDLFPNVRQAVSILDAVKANADVQAVEDAVSGIK